LSIWRWQELEPLWLFWKKRKKQLAEEGLFDESRKQALPFMPEVIGVITSPTGAVIRDILHRLQDRFPVHVLIWPVAVQGEKAKDEIAAAIEGFNDLSVDGGVPRPDLLIVARGGGSLEDLWAFNEENVVRAAASSQIPLISAVGHETDTTLIDYVSDRRAPTPTAAAEIAVPVREELLATMLDTHKRLFTGITRLIGEKKLLLDSLLRGLLNPKQLLETMIQRLDDWVERLNSSISNTLVLKENKLSLAVANLRPQNILHLIETQQQRLLTFTKLIESYHYKKVLARGFALIRDDSGNLIYSSSEVKKNMKLDIEFKDGRRKAIAEGGNAGKKKARKSPAKPNNDGQESLF